VESLAQLHGPGTLLGAIKASAAAATAPVAPHEAEERTAVLVRQMRLQVAPAASTARHAASVICCCLL
jgi:hypothetical protein